MPGELPVDRSARTTGAPAPMRRGWSRVAAGARVGLAAVLIAWLTRSGAVEWRSLTRLAAAWPLAAGAFALMAACQAVTAYRLCVLMRPQDIPLAFRDSLKLSLVGLFFGTCLPGTAGGDVVKIYYAAAANAGQRVRLTTVMLFDRVAGLVAMLLWPLAAAIALAPLVRATPLLGELIASAGVTVVVIVAGLAVVLYQPLGTGRLLDTWVRRLPAGAHVATMIDTLAGYRHHVASLVASLGVSLVAHTLAIAVVMVLARALEPEAWTLAIAPLTAFGFVANSVPLTPGGLGVGEAAFSTLFSLAGVKSGAEIMLGWRLLLVGTSLPGLVIHMRGRAGLVLAGVPAGLPVGRTSHPQAAQQ